MAQVLSAGRADGPKRVAAALQLRQCYIFLTVRLQELQGTLGNKGHGPAEKEGAGRSTEEVCRLVLWTAYWCVAVGADEGAEVFLSEISELILLRAHREDRLVTMITGQYHSNTTDTPASAPYVFTWKPPSVMVRETSSGRLTTPATDLMRDMKRSGNQTIQINRRTIRPPIPYFTTRFFF